MQSIDYSSLVVHPVLTMPRPLADGLLIGVSAAALIMRSPPGGVGGELAEHRRRQDRAFLHRGDEPNDQPILAANVDLHTAAYQWLQRRVLSGRLDARHAAIWNVAYALAEAKTQHPTL